MNPRRIAAGLWHWADRHPEWHPGRFGAKVGSYALEAGGDLLLLDPLLPQTDSRSVLDVLDALAQERDVHVLITIGYHVRSAEELCRRYGARVYGPRTCGSRLEDASLLTELEPGAAGPAGVTALPIGRPRRSERPLWLPSHAALAFGDAMVTTPDGDLRVWMQDRVDDKRMRWYRERFVPTLDALLDLPVERVLVTHGEPVLDDGAAALRGALAAEPWYQRG